jgi:hypothetical protein
MATLFAGIGAALGGGGAAAAGGAAAGAAAGATAGAAATGGGLFGGLLGGAGGGGVVSLSNILTAGSALMSIAQGMAASKRLKTEAAFADAQAAQEEASGAQERAALAKEYAELTSEQMAIQLANGLDVGTGTPMNVAAATKRQADRNLDITRQNARNRAAMQRLRSRGLMSEARGAMMGGFAGALGTIRQQAQLVG